MKRDEILEVLGKKGFIHARGHFVLSSGEHSKDYVDSDGIFLYPELAHRLCCEIGRQIAGTSGLLARIQVVVGPAKGGIVLAHELARRLNEYGINQNVKACFVEKGSHGVFKLSGTFARAIKNAAVMVVDDTVITGGTIAQVSELVAAAGGRISAVAAILNRGKVTAAKLGFPHLFYLAGMPLESWPAESCPLCRKNIPINTDYGQGAEFCAGRKH